MPCDALISSSAEPLVTLRGTAVSHASVWSTDHSMPGSSSSRTANDSSAGVRSSQRMTRREVGSVISSNVTCLVTPHRSPGRNSPSDRLPTPVCSTANTDPGNNACSVLIVGPGSNVTRLVTSRRAGSHHTAPLEHTQNATGSCAATSEMPMRLRPVQSTTRAPWSVARTTAAFTAGEMSFEATGVRVPSMSSATRRGLQLT